MVREEIYEELVRGFAQTRINNRFLAIIDGLTKRMTSGYQAHTFTQIQNMASNEILKTLRAAQQAIYGTLQRG